MCSLEQQTKGTTYRHHVMELIHHLPHDTALVVLTFLEMNDWMTIRLVSKTWVFFELTAHNLLWTSVFQSVIHHPRYEPVFNSVSRQMAGVVNYRNKLLILREAHTQYMATLIPKRIASIQSRLPVLNHWHHKYYGLDKLSTFFTKFQSKNDYEQYFGTFDPGYIASYPSDSYYNLKTQGTNKVVVVGDAATGKTCLLIRVAMDLYPEEYIPTVFDNYSTIFNWYGGRNISLWDTAGMDGYDRLRPLSYPCTNVFLVCFSVVNIPSFENVATVWLPELIRHCPQAVVVLVGTKVDLRDDPEVLARLRAKNLAPITAKEGETMAKHHNCLLYTETSALTGHNLGKHFFETIVKSSLLGLHWNQYPGGKEKKCIVC